MLARRERFEEAEREARENVRLAEETDWLGYRGMALQDLAEVLHLAGRDEEAADAARLSEDRLEQKGSTVMAARVRAFRVELEAGNVEGR